MTKYLLLTLIILTSLYLYLKTEDAIISDEKVQGDHTPQYLYKILSLQNWNKSQQFDHVILSKDDDEFIHLATEDQLDRIISKYWSNVPDYVILKLDINLLSGKLVFEANPGGSNRYYHLYEGSIPLKSVVEIK